MLQEAKNVIEEHFRRKGAKVLEWIEGPIFGRDRYGRLIQAKIKYSVADGAEFTAQITYRIQGNALFLVDLSRLTGKSLQPVLDCLNEFPEEEIEEEEEI